MTTNNLYNVIWLDDDSSIFNPLKVELLETKGIHILAHAATGIEFAQIVENNKGNFQAVILDVNCDHLREKAFNKKDKTGFTTALTSLLSIPDVPVLVYTGRPELLENSSIPQNMLNRIELPAISKIGGLEELIERVKQAVDFRFTPEFVILKQYKKELMAARKVPGAEQKIKTYLVDDMKGALLLAQDKFTSLRKIVDYIFDYCIRRNVLPHTSINGCAKLLSAGRDSNFEMRGDGLELIPKALGESLFFFTKVTQDGSHQRETSESLDCDIDNYVRETGNLGLFRAVLHVVMDILLWFDSIVQKYPVRIDPGILWNDNRNFEARNLRVYSIMNGSRQNFYADKYQLNTDDTHMLHDGDIVSIVTSTERLTPNNYWPEGVTSFVLSRNWVLISTESMD